MAHHEPLRFIDLLRSDRYSSFKNIQFGVIVAVFFIIFFLTVSGQKSNPATPSLGNEAKKSCVFA